VVAWALLATILACFTTTTVSQVTVTYSQFKNIQAAGILEETDITTNIL
jgi:hypothetical protein